MARGRWDQSSAASLFFSSSASAIWRSTWMIRGPGSACFQMFRRSSLGRWLKRGKEVAGMLMSRPASFAVAQVLG